MTEGRDTAAITAQYEAPPAPGLHRFYIRLCSWLPDWPDDVPFHFWHTATGMVCHLNPQWVGHPEAKGLPLVLNDLCEAPEEWYDRLEADDDLFKRYYTPAGYVCMYVDAVDAEAAQALARSYFTDAEDLACKRSDEGTLTKRCEPGRFQHPDPSRAASSQA